MATILVHQKQYVLGPRAVRVRPDWVTIPVADGLVLSHCPNLRVIQLRSRDDVAYCLLVILGLILDQQLEDLQQGRPATTLVEVRRLLQLEQDRLKEALHIVGQVELIVRNALGDAATRMPPTGRRSAGGRRPNTSKARPS